MKLPLRTLRTRDIEELRKSLDSNTVRLLIRRSSQAAIRVDLADRTKNLTNILHSLGIVPKLQQRVHKVRPDDIVLLPVRQRLNSDLPEELVHLVRRKDVAE